MTTVDPRNTPERLFKDGERHAKNKEWAAALSCFRAAAKGGLFPAREACKQIRKQMQNQKTEISGTTHA